MKTINFILIATISFFIISCWGGEQPTAVKPVIQGWYEITDTEFINIPQCRQWPFSHWDNDSTYVRNSPTDIDPDSICFDTSYVINDTNQYKRLIQQSVFPQCELPNIDFSKKTLLGSFIFLRSGKFLSRKIERNDFSKSVLYDVFVLVNDNTIPQDDNYMNWVLIPKLPSDYSVQFKKRRILSL